MTTAAEYDATFTSAPLDQVLIRPISEEAKWWCDENLDYEPWQVGEDGSISVAAGWMCENIREGMEEAGLVLGL